MKKQTSIPSNALLHRLGMGVLLILVGACSTPLERPSQRSDTATLPASTPLPISDQLVHSLPAPGLEPDLKPVDPLRPEIDVESQTNPRADLWSRVRLGFAIPNLDNPLVKDREKWYAAQPEYFERMTARGSRYLFHIVEEVSKRNMPSELALLPFVESAFNPQALSKAKASGIWQFMPATGTDYDLKQNVFRDDRRNVLASTRAALDYLVRLKDIFGDWHLALAAYNWGEGNVQRAIQRNRRAGLPTGYGNLRMPKETQLYVPKLQAIKNLIADPAAFGLSLPPLENHPYFLAVPIEHDIDIDVAARLAELPLNEFKALNPQMNMPVILAAMTTQILLPYDNAHLYARNLSMHQGVTASWTAWVAPRAIRPAEVAKEFGMSELELRQINRIPSGMVIKAGSTLVVPRQAHNASVNVTSMIADRAMIALAPEAPAHRKMWVKVRPNDSMASIARRYRLSASQVASWNFLHHGSKLAPGQRLVVYMPSKSETKRNARRKTPEVRQRWVAEKKPTQPLRRARLASVSSP